MPGTLAKRRMKAPGKVAERSEFDWRRHERSDPNEGVLLLELEPGTLQFQATQNLEKVISIPVFADRVA